jgi:putative lipoprotein
MRAALPIASLAAAVPATAQSPADAFHTFLQRHLADARELGADSNYSLAWSDLDGDRRPEALVYLQGRYWCGTGGCDLLIFTPERDGWRLVTRVNVARPPIMVLQTRSRGWRDLGVFVSGGGIQPGYQARLSYDGRSYPDNPTVGRAWRVRAGESGRVLIRNDSPVQPLF